MKLILFAAITMVAFAANSVFNRIALLDGTMDPTGFSVIRLAAGATTLFLLHRGRIALLRGLKNHVVPAAALLAYMLGFSFAYVALDAGLGALILFGGVQVTMFAGAVWGRDVVPWPRWAGAALALSGLVVLLLPSGAEGGGLSLSGFVFMTVAAVGWGIYSLLGRGSKDALGDTASAFILATPVCAVAYALFGGPVTMPGALWAILAGAITSGMGYAMWYNLLPQLGATRAAVLQLTVPVIAAAGGVLFLGETLTLTFVIACLMVLGGVGLSLLKR